MRMWVALAAVVLGVAPLAQQADTTRNPLAGSADAAAAGRRIYDQTCLSCHGAAGRGDRGPALDAGRFTHGDADGDLFHTIRAGVPGSQMPPFPALSDTQVWQLVAYLRTLSSETRDAAPGPRGAAAGAASARAREGEALFFGKAGCAACHDVNGRGGAVGPDLSAAGRTPAAALRAKILSPSAAPAAARRAPPQTIIATLKDGRELRGVRRNEDTFSVQIVDASGTLHSLDKPALQAYRVENRSLMPADYATRLTSSELDSVVSYLETLSARAVDAGVAAPVDCSRGLQACREPAGGVGADRLARAAAEPANWLMYWGDYRATHYSGLSEIDAGNVARLRAAWTFPMPGDSVLEATPIVADGVMYTTQPGAVVALDARTGRQIWKFTRQQKVKSPYEINPFNRGAAIVGQRLFVGTLDAALVALDARTGLPLWETQVADTMLGYSLTSAPLVVKDKVIVGITGGEFGARGFLDAYDAATGRRLWRWYSVPAPGEFGSETWKGDSWKQGGSPMWLTGSYDPELNLVYWTVGNPGPQIDRSARGELDNLFSDSVVAIDPDRGERRWHYQFTPNDGHDWDSCQAVVLVDRVWRGQMRKLLLHADRNGMFYVLDRASGALLAATPFVYQNWNTGFDAKGKPMAAPGSNSSVEGSYFVYPSLVGGTNFQAPSYSPSTGWFYLEYRESGQQYISRATPFEAGRQYIGSAAAAERTAQPKPGEPAASAGIKAIDPESGQTIWDFKIDQPSLTDGVLATAGNVVFGTVRDGNIVALDARSGRHLWHFQTNASIAASPISYSVEGRQYVAVAAGNVVYAFTLADAAAPAAPPARDAAEGRYATRQTGDTVRLEDAQTRTAVSIVPSLGNIAFDFSIRGQNVLHWPFASVEAFKAKPAMSGIPFLGPWANRLDEPAFYANGRRYPFDMTLGNIRGGAIPIHGFLTLTDRWRVTDTGANAESAWVTSRLDVAADAAWMRQWPFAHTIDITYRLQNGALEVATAIANRGSEAMPVAIGFHPYFRLTDSRRDDWTISVAARTHWLLGPTKIPTGATEPIERLFPNPQAAALKDYRLDDVFGDLVRDAQGRATMAVAGGSQRLEVTLGPNYRSVVIWAPGSDSNFVCIEPMAGITDAINLAHKGVYKELQTVAPGGTWSERFWIQPRGFN
jgi:PQQ-dependent dehydrogenase (methanol/ethanol family)